MICQDCLNQSKTQVAFYCRSCGKAQEYPICDNCKVERKYEDIQVFTYYYYIQDAIKQLKFNKIKPLAKDLGLLIKDDIQDYLRKNKIQNILYIPISKNVQKERGFNHLKEILKYAVPSFLVKDYIVKHRETAFQMQLNKEDRFKNLKDAFSLTVDSIKGNTLVFDDILTTGATLLEIYNLIKDKTDGKIYAYVIARG
ncbi:ComF protein [Sulfurihydrogenibium azorense Az-Fu1]|uniref:ComF protein n=1 Tax=Sulfurihydrogenibium azorense (strain DSM 15241 / OCM 825 / Az-Fu1) TaxID=204536 RepID=C1DV17_SULAA|nr:ComF protein [Sulfurihydrogenibium azorense Az-Fu1]